MNPVRQEITLDSNYLSKIIKELGEKYIDDSELRDNYNRLISYLKDFHLLCVDNPAPPLESKWFLDFRKLLIELAEPRNYKYGEIVLKLVSKDLFEHFLDGSNLLPKAYLVNDRKTDYNFEIAKASIFKLLLSDNHNSDSEILRIAFDEFIKDYNNKDSILYRSIRSIDIREKEKIQNFEFLKPYLYFAKKLELWDKILLKDENHFHFISTIFDLVEKIEKVIIRADLNKLDPIDKKFIKKFEDLSKKKFPDCEIIFERYTRPHPRKIQTDYSIVESTHTFDILEFRSGSWVAKQAIRLTCHIL